MATEKEIFLCFLNGDSQRRIASSLKVSRNTVFRIVAAYMAQKLEASDVSGLTSEALHERLFPTETPAPQQVIPDYEYVHRELLKDGGTVKQLWEEYVMDCRESGNLYFRYTQFCKKYRDYVDTHRLTMHIRHKPGEKVMVDWAGKTIPFYNPVTGEVSKAYLFVSTLPFSMYCYAEVFHNRKDFWSFRSAVPAIHLPFTAHSIPSPDSMSSLAAARLPTPFWTASSTAPINWK